MVLGHLWVRKGVSYCGGEDVITNGSEDSVSDVYEVLGNSFLPRGPALGWCEEAANCSKQHGE